MSTEAVRALDAAACNAAANGSPDTPTEVRTEHLLAVLAVDPGSRARRVLNDLGVDIAAIKRELQCHIAVNPTRPARWWKRRPPDQHGCSFCGRTTAAVSPTPDRPAPRWQSKRRAHPPRPGPPPPVPPAVGPKPGRKGRAFRSLDTLLIRHGGRDVLHGSVLALASAKRSRACLRGMGISSKAGHAHRHPGARPGTRAADRHDSEPFTVAELPRQPPRTRKAGPCNTPWSSTSYLTFLVPAFARRNDYPGS